MRTLQKRSERNRLFIVKKWMQCLLLRLEYRSGREASRHAGFMSNCLTVSHTCLLYLPRRWVFCSWCSWSKWARWVHLKFYLSLSGFNQVEWGREICPRFPFTTPGVCELPLIPTATEVAYLSVCAVLVDD